jgi:hypothetical protein
MLLWEGVVGERLLDRHFHQLVVAPRRRLFMLILRREGQPRAHKGAGTTVEPHLRAGLAGNDSEAVVLDLMQPIVAGRQFVGFGRKTRRDEPGREGAHTQHNAHS